MLPVFLTTGFGPGPLRGATASGLPLPFTKTSGKGRHSEAGARAARQTDKELQTEKNSMERDTHASEPCVRVAGLMGSHGAVHYSFFTICLVLRVNGAPAAAEAPSWRRRPRLAPSRRRRPSWRRTVAAAAPAATATWRRTLAPRTRPPPPPWSVRRPASAPSLPPRGSACRRRARHGPGAPPPPPPPSSSRRRGAAAAAA